MAEKGMYEAFNKMNEIPFMSVDNVKRIAAWYIDTSEKFATQALELQEKAFGWAKETPFAPMIDAQQKLARKLVERSVSTARSMWQLEAQN